MAQSGYLVKVRSDKDTHFTGAIAQNAQESEDILLPGTLASYARARLRSINIISDQNLSWEVWLFAKDTFIADVADLDLLFPRGRWRFDSGDGAQIAATGPYYYYIDGLDLPYQDEDMTQELHVMLVNRSATGKNAGATGEIVIEFQFELTTGW